MPTFAVTYSYSDATCTARDEHRPHHVEFLRSQFESGRLVKSGPFGPKEEPGALLLVTGDTKADVQELMDQDPFFGRGLIEERTIRQWNIFFGADNASRN